jgi:DNA-binding GntR family transcriptional regulator
MQPRGAHRPQTGGPDSLADDAYTRLRGDIVSGRIRPNARLIAADLAQELAISRTPVREALQLLAADGLVASAKRGYVVREHTADEIREIYEVRAGLESMAARLAAERGSQEHLDGIAGVGADRPELARSAREHLVDANDRFHGRILDAAGNERLRRLVDLNRQYFFNHRIAELYTDDEAAASLEGHRRIVQAIAARDGDAAAREAAAHVLEALAVTLRKLR